MFHFLRNESILAYGVNYLHSGVKWPIEIEFVIGNVNIFELEKQTCEHTIFKYRTKYMHQTQKGSECIINTKFSRLCLSGFVAHISQTHTCGTVRFKDFFSHSRDGMFQ